MARYPGLDPQLRFKAYRRHSGKKSSVPAIGYGHIGSDVTEAHVRAGTELNQAQAEAQLDTDIASHVAAVNAALAGTPVTQNEFDGLVLHAYRIGIANFRKSGVLQGFLEGNKEKAKSQWTGDGVRDTGDGGNVDEKLICFPKGSPRVSKLIRIKSININIPLVPEVDTKYFAENEAIPSPYEAKDLLCIAPTCETSGEGLVKSHKCQCMQTECDGVYCNRLYGFIDERLKSALDYDDEQLCGVSGSVCCCHCPNCEEIRA
eukprot:294647_1